MGEVWVVGSLNVDMIVECRRFPEAGETLFGDNLTELWGGKGGNQATALAKLGCRPRLVAAVGDDGRGKAYLQALAELGVDTALVGVRPGVPTGLALIEVASGENRILVVPGANATLSAAEVEASLAAVCPGDLVLFQLELPMETVTRGIEVAHARGAVVVLDPAPARPLPTSLLRCVDYLTPNSTEAQICSGQTEDCAQALLEQGCTAVVQKSGAEGAALITPDAKVPHAAFAVQVVDTVGAGDAFNAGFAAALSRGQSASEAVRWGNAAGALSTRAAGAQRAQPSLAELQALLG